MECIRIIVKLIERERERENSGSTLDLLNLNLSTVNLFYISNSIVQIIEEDSVFVSDIYNHFYR